MMNPGKLTINVSESLGGVSAEIMSVERMDFLFVFAHGAGAGMMHPFMVKLSEALLTHGIGTMRYNFPYMERGSKRPDPPAVAEKAVSRAIQAAADMFPKVPLLAGGKSFGGRMTSQALSKTKHAAVAGLVFAGFPLHAAGRAGIDRAAHLANIGLPMLFLQGTRDALALMPLMEKVCAGLPTADLEKFEGADHSFKAGRQDLIPVLASKIRAWSLKLGKES